jgi:hypothetical protein
MKATAEDQQSTMVPTPLPSTELWPLLGYPVAHSGSVNKHHTADPGWTNALVKQELILHEALELKGA